MEKKYILLLKVILCFLLFSSFILFISKKDIAKMYFIEKSKLHVNDIYSPHIYELVYVRRDNNDTWIFNKTRVSSEFIFDVNKKNINFVLINGRFYKIDSIREDNKQFHLKLIDKCFDKTFFSCSSSNIASHTALTVLHVLGYHFDY